MTDQKDDYYQPWLRDPGTGAGKTAAGDVPQGLAKPPASPPLGLDVSAYPIDGTPPGGFAVGGSTPPPDKVAAGPSIAARLRGGANRFADWTIRVGARADIPTKIERLELPRRTQELAENSGRAAAHTGRALGRGTMRGWAALATASVRGWQRLALTDHMGRMAHSAKSGIGQAAGKTRDGLEAAAKASMDGVSEAADKAKTRLRPPAKTPPSLPPSGLDQLLEREAATANPPSTAHAAPDLPLFAAEAVPETLAATAPQTTAKPLPMQAPKTAAKIAPVAPRLARASAGGEGASTTAGPRHLPLWIMAGIALLAGMYWLGSRSGPGRAEIETAVADYIMAHPEIIPQAMDKYRANEMAKAIDAIRPALTKPFSGAWAGNASGDVTVTVFTDYGCGYCRASVPDIDRLVREDPGVKIVYRELPIIAPQSADAALMALRAARQGKYDAFHHAMFAAGSLDKSAIAAAATKAGVVTDGSADATANPEILQRELASNMAMAQQLQLNATPSWIIGDQMLQGALGISGLREAVAKARAKK